jgi:protein involved in polysaccharide export with SLBB domain
MIKRPLVLILVLGVALDCFPQTTVTTPSPSGAQCVGADCDRARGNPSAPPGVVIGPTPSVPYLQTQPGLERGNENNPLYPQYPDLYRRMPEYQRTEFERFVQAAVGRDLRIFGHEYFEDVPTTFAPVDRIPVPADYVIGPGDELLIRAWGKIDIDSRQFVDRSGQIYLPRVGAINVSGLRYEQLEPFIHGAIGRVFRDFDLNVSIGQLRSIQVFVLGYARRPGTYTVSSLSTLVNTIFASGGPASDGSMRHVQLKRTNTLLSDLDLYDVILKGDKSGDLPLQSGDVIYIPHVGPLVAVAGSVNRPAIYEMRQSAPPANPVAQVQEGPLVPVAGGATRPSPYVLGNATDLGEVIEDAGGLTSVAAVGRISLERINGRADRAFDEFPLDASGLRRELKNGDVIHVYPVSPKITNSVTLRGNVAQPGRYLWHEGMRVSDLIPSRDVLITRKYWNAQNAIVPVERNDDEFGSRPRLYRRNRNQLERGGGTSLPNDTANGAQDSTQTPAAGNYNDLSNREPNDNQMDRSNRDQLNDQYDQYDQNRPRLRDEQGQREPSLSRDEETGQEDLRNEIRHRGSEINWEHAVIERLNHNDLTTELIPFNLGIAVDQPSSSENRALAPGDVITIFSQEDLPVATENRAKYVQIAGEVKAPGVYRVEPGETLRDAVIHAGGLGSHAYLYGAELLRESARQEQRKRLAQMVERMQRELQAAAAAPSGAAPEDRADVKARLDEQKDFIAKLAHAQPTGRVVLELKPTASTVEDIPAMPLEDGDIFTVASKGDTVQVLGSVYNENTFRFRPDKQVGAYLRIAGGPTRDADKGRVFVIRADGTVVSRAQQSSLLAGNRFDSMRLMPGDAIVVPQRFKFRSGLTAFRDWSQVFANLALGAASINVIR